MNQCMDGLTLPLFKESSLDFESCANIHEVLRLKILINKAYLSSRFSRATLAIHRQGINDLS